jgi:chemosensory pili system protein ChpA (sensor histidine kinase/response regulator)
MSTGAKAILVVDDNPITARCVGSLVSRIGFDAVLAFHGEEALNRLAEAQFVAVISDVDMPRVTGFELLHNIRLCYPETPVVLMTGSCNEDWRESARAGGAWAFLEKPVTSDQLDALFRNGAETHRDVPGMRVFRPPQAQLPRAHQASPQVNWVPPTYGRGEPEPAA